MEIKIRVNQPFEHNEPIHICEPEATVTIDGALNSIGNIYVLAKNLIVNIPPTSQEGSVYLRGTHSFKKGEHVEQIEAAENINFPNGISSNIRNSLSIIRMYP